MRRDSSTPIPFRWPDLVAVSLVVSLLLSLASLLVADEKEVARGNDCQNNLKTIGLAIHNFHDTYNGLPPLALGDARASFFLTIMPFAEQKNVYNLFNGGNERANTEFGNVIDGSSAEKPLSSWTQLTAKERDLAGSVTWMHCPARERKAPALMAMADKTDLYAGPLGDYAVVFIDQDPKNGGAFPLPDTSDDNGWQLHQDSCNFKDVGRQKGAIRLAYIDCLSKNYQGWKPRDSFARCTDGTSNCFVLGEKHVRTDELGKYSEKQEEQDGIYFFTSKTGGRNYNVARNIALPLAKDAKDKSEKDQGPRKDFGFGSAHEGIVRFLFLDGSVYTASVTLDTRTRAQLGHCQDGGTVELPK